jgi:membrane protease YdiL (CAAX protease family)
MKDEPDPSVAVAPEPPLSPEERRTGALLLVEVAVVLLVCVIPHIIHAIAAADGTGAKPPIALAIAERVVYFLRDCGLVFLLIARAGERWASFGIVRPRAIDVVAGVGFWLAASLAASACIAALGLGTIHFPRVALEGRAPIQYLLIVAASAASSVPQEIVFRAYLIPRFERIFGSARTAVLLSATLFSAMHVYQGFAGITRTFVAGLVFGGGFVWVRRAWPFAIAHTIHNALTYLA